MKQLMNQNRKTDTFKTIPGLAAIIGLMLVLFTDFAVAQQYKKMTRLGTSEAVCRGGIETAEELQEFFANNPDAIRALLADSGWSGSADALLEAVANGEMIDRTYPVGTRLAWSGAKVNGQYVAKPYREWAGAKPFEAFQVNVASNCQIYHISIPKACCNVSLVEVASDQSEACQPKPVEPVAAVSPVKEVAPAKKSTGLVPYFGVFAGSETRPRFETAWAMDMRDASGVVGVRAGLMKEVSAKTVLFAQASYVNRNSINIGNVYPKDNLAIDIGVDRRLNQRVFIGGGIGIWNVDDSDFRDASLFAHVGGDIGKSNLQWVLEGRVFDSDSDRFDSISDNKMFSIGFRYLFR